MAKLTIPAKSLLGTPLSADEMKQIVGGMGYSRVCVCTFYSNGEATASTQPNAANEASCSEGCDNYYKEHSATYASYAWSYTAQS